MKPSIFIVSYYWPPAGGPGVQRWLKFVKYLSKDQFDITLVIPENPDYASVDTSLLDEIPQGINTIKVSIKEPSRFLKKLLVRKTKKLQRGFIDKKPGILEKALLWLRGNYFIPDARISWVDRVVKELKDNSAFAKAGTLITTGPPHSVHLVGMRLKQLTPKLDWLADFRDPWTTIGYHKDLRLSKKAAMKHLQLESKVLTGVDQIIVTSPSTKTEFQSKTNKPITVITNGFDLKPNRTNQPEGKFTVSHVGTLLADRNPLLLWQVLSELCHENENFKTDFKLQLAGNVSQNILDSIEVTGLSEQLEIMGYLDHDRAVDLMNHSQVLLLIEIDTPETRAIIPGKAFEYIASRRPIIGIGPADSDIMELLRESNSGQYFRYHDMHLKKAIMDHYKKYQNGDLLGNATNVNAYHRKELTQQLVKILHN